MRKKTNVPMEFAVSLSVLMILTISGVWLGRVLTPEKMEMALGFAIFVLVLLAITSYFVAYRPLLRLLAMEEELERMASADPMTGLLNRQAILEKLDLEVGRAERSGKPLSVAMVDIDGFREINARFGPGAGDSVLRSVSGLIGETCRQYDAAGRIGSEEFLMVLPDIEADDAARAAERLRHRIDATQFAFHGEGFEVTASIGVTTVDFEKSETPDDAIARAGEALRQARSEGGNCVRAAAPLPAAKESVRRY